MRLNLGAGADIRADFTNIDIRGLSGIDLVADVRKLPLEDNVAEQIVAQDVAEHISYPELEDTLKEWLRVLQPGGIIEIRTPDWYKIFRAAISRRLPEDEAFRLVFGDQSPEAGGYETGGHKAGKSMSQWLETLKRIGFVDVTIEPDDHEYNLRVMARKPEPEVVPDVEGEIPVEVVVS